MSISLAILTGIILIIMFGAGQRVLDQMRLTDKQALLLLVLICIGIIIPPIYIGGLFCFSIGGFLEFLSLCLKFTIKDIFMQNIEIILFPLKMGQINIFYCVCHKKNKYINNKINCLNLLGFFLR